MLKKIFKAGDYGSKGNYSVEDLKSWIGKEFSITAGHVGDWLKNGYVRTAIPVAGKGIVKAVDEEGYLLAETTNNEFGEKVTNGGLYTDLSLGVTANKDIDHLAILGYAPPHIKDLDKYAEFSSEVDEDVNYIEFNEGGEKVTIEEILEAIKALDATESNITGLNSIQEELWKKLDQAWYIEKLESEGYKVAKEFSEDEIKEFAEGIGFNLKKKENKTPETQEEMEARIRAEFAAVDEKKERNATKKVFKEKFIKIFPPVMKGLAEFAADAAYSEENYDAIIEFSEDVKVPMREHLEKMAEEGGPFKNLFGKITNTVEFNAGNSGKDDGLTAEEIMEAI